MTDLRLCGEFLVRIEMENWLCGSVSSTLCYKSGHSSESCSPDLEISH